MTPKAVPDRCGLLSAFSVPPAMLGQRPVLRTREDAARERLAYMEAMGMDPYGLGDGDVELVASTEALWRAAVLTRREALDCLRPLQVALDERQQTR